MAKVLVADDAFFTRKMLREILEAEGHTVVEACDGQEAVQKFQDEKPDLVLLDLSMPGTDGLAALRQIKAAAPEAKIVVVSALGQPSVMQKVHQLGVHDFLPKPFRPSQVRELLAQWLKGNPSP